MIGTISAELPTHDFVPFQVRQEARLGHGGAAKLGHNQAQDDANRFIHLLEG